MTPATQTMIAAAEAQGLAVVYSDTRRVTRLSEKFNSRAAASAAMAQITPDAAIKKVSVMQDAYSSAFFVRLWPHK